MFIYNFKINGTKVFKTFFAGVVLLVTIILGISVYRIFNGAKTSPQEVAYVKINDNEYTNFLKIAHENIDSYVGKKINFTGYVYRVNDLQNNQFILARNMVISSDYQYLVVGFLSECENAKDFQNDCWIEVNGEIQKGSYHGSDMPVLKIVDIKKVNKPENDFVKPPTQGSVPTFSSI